MVNEQQNVVTDELKNAILKLCYETIPFFGKIEIDGLICIHVAEEKQDLIVKLHESLFRSAPAIQGDAKLMPTSQHQRFIWNNPSRNSSSMLLSNSIARPDNARRYSSISSDGRDTLNHQSVELPLPINHIKPSRSISAHVLGTSDRPPYNEDYQQARMDITEETNASNTDNNDHSEIVQTPLYKQLWDKYKIAGGGTARVKNPRSGPDVGTATSLVSGSLVCKICRVAIGSIDKLEKHYTSSHRIYMCKQCMRTFSMFSNMKRHMRLHSGHRPYHCNICSKAFTRKDDLTNHILKHKESKPFRCGICQKSYTERSSIRGHLRRDHGACAEDIHICTQCGSAHSDLSNFMSHLKTHTKTAQSGHISFVQEHSSILSNSSTSTIFSKSVKTAAGVSSDQERTSPHDLIQQAEQISGKNAKPSDPQNMSAKIQKDPLDLSQTRNTAANGVSSSSKQLDVLISRPDGSPCAISVNVGNLSLQLNGSHDQNENQPSSTSAHTSMQANSDDDDRQPVESELKEKRECKCQECNIIFTEFKDFCTHMLNEHKMYICNLCPEMRFETGELYQEHVRVLHLKLMAKDADQTRSQSVNDTNNSELKQPNSFAQVDNNQSEKTETIDIQKIKQEFSPSSSHGSTGSLQLDENLVMSPTQPVFPGLSINFNVDQLPISGNDDDYAMHRSSDSYNMGRIIGMKPYLHSPSSPSFSLKKPRLSSVKQVIRDDKGYLLTPTTFRCSACSEVFNECDEYLNHCTEIHQKYGCKYCGQMFTQCGNRNRHLRYHSGDRPYVCPECGDTFARQDALKNHIDARHKKASCPICGMVFAKLHLASQHLKQEHGVASSP